MAPRDIKLYKICLKKLTILRRKIKELKNKAITIRVIYEDENVKNLCNFRISNSLVILLKKKLKKCPKNLKGRIYDLEDNIMALQLFKKSPACYRLLRHMFTLPSPISLNNLLNKVPLKPGINKHIFSSLKEMADTQLNNENLCILSFDKMSLNDGLKMDGIQDIDDQGIPCKSNKIGTKAFVFMLAGIRSKWRQPIAFYFCPTLNAEKLTEFLKEMLTECFNANLNVVATVCDFSSVNLEVFKTLGATTEEPYFLHGQREIVAILNPPHLLKCTRNLLMKYDVDTTNVQSNDNNVKGIVKWSYIKSLYNLDKNSTTFQFAPALSECHLHPNIKQQKKLNLAAEVFCHEVAVGLFANIASKELPSEGYATAMFIEKYYNLFDALYTDSIEMCGKEYSTNLTIRSRHIQLFMEMKKFISSIKFLGYNTSPPSQEGWIHTMNAIERLWKQMQTMEINSLRTHRLNRDPLENFFSSIRDYCGPKIPPSVQQFMDGFKTALLSNMLEKTTNCDDNTTIMPNNLSSFLT